MKAQLKLTLAAAAAVMLTFSLTAGSADAPPKAEPSQPTRAAPEKAKKAVIPHNHMRDGKGLWVPEKKSRKEPKKEGGDAAKASAAAQAQK